MTVNRLSLNSVGRVAETETPSAFGSLEDGAAKAELADPAGMPPFQASLPAAEVHARLRHCLAQMQWAEQGAFLWFCEMEQRRLYRELGYASMQAYASTELGLTANRVNRYLHLMRDLERLPLIRTALYAGDLGWTKARAIVRVAGPSTEERWLDTARSLGRRELELRVTGARTRAAARRRKNPAQPLLATLPGGHDPTAEPTAEAEVGCVTGNGSCIGGGTGIGNETGTGNETGIGNETGTGNETGIGNETGTEIGAENRSGTGEKTDPDAGTGVAWDRETAGQTGYENGAPIAAARHCQNTDEHAVETESPFFRPPMAMAAENGSLAASEQLVDEGPVPVVLRLLPLELARFEAQIEKIRKQRWLPPETSREQILLHALDLLIMQGSPGPEWAGDAEPDGHGKAQPGGPGDDDGRQPGDEHAGELGRGRPDGHRQCTDANGGGPGSGHGHDPEGRSTAVPRGTDATPYQIVIYKCELCQAAAVQTQRGPRSIGRARAAAVECDAVVVTSGQRNHATIPPSVRRMVLTRDRHRCRAVGCRNTRFLEVHHVLPRERGGTNHAENLVTLCSRCHALWHQKRLDARMLQSARL